MEIIRDEKYKKVIFYIYNIFLLIYNEFDTIKLKEATKMEFMLGCNYWASNAGTEMWRQFDIEVIKKDVAELSKYGVKYLRVFPMWRDFQPVMPVYEYTGICERYCLEGDAETENPYYLDEKMMQKFSQFLDVCDVYGIKVIVGLITGWMSGRLFIPTALYGKNVITDPLAIHFEQLFIEGFVSEFRDRDTIYAWNPGNECNCLAEANRWEAVSWMGMIANAINSADGTRPIISGMHSLEAQENKNWRIKDQAFYSDMLTIHPYAYFCEHTSNDDNLSYRTAMHPTAQNKFYAEIGKKPCFAEEVGTLNFCSDENSANWLRLNMFSLWANGSTGVLWWCGHDQSLLDTYPYRSSMLECELGILKNGYEPKPNAIEMKKFAQFMDSIDFELPKAKTDAVCLVTKGQDQWGVGYMTHLLMRKIGMNPEFAYAEDGVPDAKLYIMPSVNGPGFMNNRKYDELKRKVYEGADLYMSVDNAVILELEKLAGVKVVDSYLSPFSETLSIDGEKIEFSAERRYTIAATDAEIIARYDSGDIAITVNRYGKGRVFFVAFPLEKALMPLHDAFSGKHHMIYKKLFGEYICDYPVKSECDEVVVTAHEDGDVLYIVAINHTDKVQKIEILQKDYTLEKVYYGSENQINPYDACVLKFRK